MRLHYDRKHDRYVGKQIQIAEHRFAAALRLLLEGDTDPQLVLESLLDESVWLEHQGRRAGLAGVCILCGRPMAAVQRRFCSVVCEAGAIARGAWPA